MKDLTRKYVFKGELQLKTALHIGGGVINLTGTDSPVVKTPTNEPYIPGSSFKGAFRATVEKLIGAIPNPELWCCYFTEGDCPSVEIHQKKFNEDIKKYKWDEIQIAQQLENRLCSSCKLFGSPFSASKIFFSELYINEWPEVTQIRDGVGIDRDSEKAVDQHKYDYEVVPVGSTFNMEIVLENPTNIDLSLTCLGINEFVSGNYIGGLRSRGLGKCKIKSLEGYELNLTDEDTRIANLKKYLLNTKIEEKMSQISGIDNFLIDRIQELLN